MSKALEGMHYCKEHQGNYSHYAAENCEVCRLRARVASLKESLADSVSAEWHTTRVDQLKEDSRVQHLKIADLTQQLGAANAELTKWRNWKPDDETMQELKEQAKDSSLAAKTAYIGALENRLAAANGRVEKMREAVQGWIDEHESHGPCQCEDAYFSTPEHSTPAYTCPSCSWNASLEPLRAALSDLPVADKEKS